MSIDGLFSRNEPVLPVRGVHLDLKGTPPTPGRLERLLEVFSALRYNAVLVEWEDSFPWSVEGSFRSETAYTVEQVEAFHAAAGRLGLEVIPLVQCLGHMETPLAGEAYAPLRERPWQAGVLNPLAPGARELVERMVEDVLARSPGVRHFHLGGDEAWSFASHPDTRAYVEQHGKGALYLHHVEPILDALIGRGIRPILWHDMMREWDAPALARLAQKADLCVWGYHGHPDTTKGHWATAIIQRFADAGVRMWGATAYKGATGPSADRPNVELHRVNATAWAEVAQRFGMAGVFATAWSRYSTHNLHSELIDASLDTLALVAGILHDGAAPADGLDAALAVLDALGEREGFEACRSACEELAEARKGGWYFVQAVRELVVMATLDARRRTGSPLMVQWRNLRRHVDRADRAGDALRHALAGRVEPLWVDRYLAERIEPLREEAAALAPRIRLLDPAGWQAEHEMP